MHTLIPQTLPALAPAVDPAVAPVAWDGADAALWLGRFDGEEQARLALDPARLGYVFVAEGSVTANGQALRTGDALTLDGEAALELSAGQGALVLFFDLAR